MPRASLLALFLAMLLTLPAAIRAGGGHPRDRLWQGPAEAEMQLPDAPVEPGSLTCAVEGELLREGIDYRLDAVAGRVLVLHPRWLGRPCRIDYRVLRLALPANLALQRREDLPWVVPGRAGDSLAAPPGLAGLPGREEEFGSRLRTSGSFLRGIRVGTGGQVGMESGLRLQVDGQIGPDVEVEAFLSDRNTPIQPEGRSESLEEVDRIHVAVRSPHWSAMLGDIDLHLRSGDYLDYRRTVDGLRAGYDNRGAGGGSPVLVQAHLAGSRGRFHRMEFAGQEGVQGPWQLRSDQGSGLILVLAGSERVWLDGIALSRGEERDYTMDYGLGQLHFTVRRPITSHSRIQVEYQYSERLYARTLYGVEARTPLGQGVEMSLGLAGERDDADRPLDAFLDAQDRRLLAEAGDGLGGAAAAWGSGVRRVVAGQGSWRLVDSLAGRWGWYEWAELPPGGGADEYRYELRFSELGRDEQGLWLGDYSRQYSSSGRVWYRFEGEAGGAWAPVIPLAAPTAAEVLDTRLTWRRGGFELEGEAALSRQDLNLLSGRDDEDNQGAALRGRLRWRSQPWPAARPLGRGEVEVAGIREQADFRPLQNVDEIEFERLYGMARGGGLERADLAWGLRGGDTLLWRQRASLLRRAEEESRLWEGVWRWLPRRGPTSEGEARQRRLEAPASRSRLDGLRLEQGYGWERHRLLGGWEGERRERMGSGAAGEAFRQGLIRFERRLGVAGEASLEQQRRLDERRDDEGWAAHSRADQWRSRLRWAGDLQGEVDWTHRRLDYAGADSVDAVRDLALLDLRRRGNHSAWSLRYQVEQNLAAERLTQYLQVDSLQGDYSRDPFNPDLFVPDPDGDYIALPWETGRQRRAARLLLEGDWRWERGVWSGDHRLLAEETSRLADPTRLYLLQPAAFQGDSTQSGRIHSRQDLELAPGGAGGQRRWRLRWQEERSLEQPSIAAARRAWTRRLALRAQDRLGSGRASLEVETRRQEVLMPGQAQERREIRALRLEGEFSREVAPGWLGRATAELEAARDAPSDLAGRRLRLEPALDGRLGLKGSLGARLSWQQAWADQRIIPYELLGGARVGRTWRAGLDGRFQIGRQTRLTLSWQLDALPERRAQQTGRLQIQSFF
jgi:hypothetical protein